MFVELTGIPPAATRREVYALTGGEAAREQRGGAAIPATVGTVHRDPGLTLGSVNQYDTWLQRRDLLGFRRLPADGPDGPLRAERRGAELTWHYSAGRFGEEMPKGRIAVDGEVLVFEVDVVRAGGPRAAARRRPAVAVTVRILRENAQRGRTALDGLVSVAIVLPGGDWPNREPVVCGILLIELSTGDRTRLARTHGHDDPRHPHPVFTPDGSTVLLNHADEDLATVNAAAVQI